MSDKPRFTIDKYTSETAAETNREWQMGTLLIAHGSIDGVVYTHAELQNTSDVPIGEVPRWFVEHAWHAFYRAAEVAGKANINDA